ncbi:unnamed protein product [Eruca vesicaria subsp. sativa]|uniref:Uncharacterized protein n=1 Tax=Eruca vesicaria subsp. sativa TaxID=29727 RepID=A0ABC8JDT4_ERUVS|nr:unnamed protein product [Eruca vesicaria subsp. sativa]
MTDLDLHVSNMEERMYTDISLKLLRSTLQRLNSELGMLICLVESMNHHHSLYKQVLMRALYGVKAKTLFILSVFAAAFSGSSKNIKEMEEEVPWEPQNIINPEIKNTLLSDRFTVIQDLEALEFGVEKLYAEVQEGSVPNLILSKNKRVACSRR